ncbi:MAG: hypothetical protein PV344_00665, partial [Anaplasma sp.]|nr:hypothetical protein [Anaplasma sp.]
KAAMSNQPQQAPTTPSVVYLPFAPRAAAPFYGEPHEDVEDWLNQYDRVARHNNWTAEQRMQNLYFALEGTARRWFENHEASLTAWDTCVAELKRTFAGHHRRQRAEDLLQTRTQGPNESVTSFVEDVLRLSSRADPQATDEKKLRILMRGVKDDIFGGLVRNPPTTVEAFVTEATNMERALQARAFHYQRHPSVAAATLFSGNNARGDQDLREIIRDVVREELRKLLPAATRPATLSIAEAVREEVRQALQPEVPVSTAAPEEPTLSYAAMARRPPPVNHQYSPPPRRSAPTPQYLGRHDEHAQYARPEQAAPRKT